VHLSVDARESARRKLRSQSAMLEMRINDLERTLSEMAEYTNMLPVAGSPDRHDRPA